MVAYKRLFVPVPRGDIPQSQNDFGFRISCDELFGKRDTWKVGNSLDRLSGFCFKLMVPFGYTYLTVTKKLIELRPAILSPSTLELRFASFEPHPAVERVVHCRSIAVVDFAITQYLESTSQGLLLSAAFMRRLLTLCRWDPYNLFLS